MSLTSGSRPSVRHLSFRDQQGQETTLHSRRFVSMADPHHGGIEWTLVPENWSGRVEVVTAIDGRVSNAGVARYRQLEGRHLNPVAPRTLGPEVIALKAETRQSNLYISQAARTRRRRAPRRPAPAAACPRPVWRCRAPRRARCTRATRSPRSYGTQHATSTAGRGSRASIAVAQLVDARAGAGRDEAPRPARAA